MKKPSFIKRIAGTVIMPLIAFAICYALCYLKDIAYFGGEKSWIVFFRASATVMLTTLALQLNLNTGRFDFSLGAISLLSSVISAQICSALGLPTIVMLAISIAAGAVLGLLSGLLYVLLRLPAIIVSLGVTLIYEGLAFVITGGYGVSFVTNTELTSFPGIRNYIIVIVAALALMIFVFDFTKFGYEYKALMSGQNISVNTGINETKNALVCYMISGMLMSVVGFISATNIGTVQMSLNFGSIGVMFTAFFPMFVGGFIGKFSNDKLGYLLGAVTSAFVSLLYTRLNVDASVQQIVSALILVVFVVYLSNENKLAALFASPKRSKKNA